MLNGKESLRQAKTIVVGTGVQESASGMSHLSQGLGGLWTAQ